MGFLITKIERSPVVKRSASGLPLAKGFQTNQDHSPSSQNFESYAPPSSTPVSLVYKAGEIDRGTGPWSTHREHSSSAMPKSGKTYGRLPPLPLHYVQRNHDKKRSNSLGAFRHEHARLRWWRIKTRERPRCDPYAHDDKNGVECCGLDRLHNLATHSQPRIYGMHPASIINRLPPALRDRQVRADLPCDGWRIEKTSLP